MHLNTAVVKHILPKLEQYEGKPVSDIPFQRISREILEETGKGVNFNFVGNHAEELLRHDLSNSKTVSFNIVVTEQCMRELTSSSKARRDRFSHLVSLGKIETSHRIGMVLNEISGKVSFTINVTERFGVVNFVAIVGFYGTSINGWYERHKIGATVAYHSIPSTHYMPRESAMDTIFLIEKKVSLKVAK